MGSWPLLLGFFIGWLSSISPPLRCFAPSFLSPTSAISVFSYGLEALPSSSPCSAMFLLHGLSLLTSAHILKNRKKTFEKSFITRKEFRRSLASPSTRRLHHARLVLELLQITSALPRFLFISAKHVVASRRGCLTGMHSYCHIADTFFVRICFMFSQVAVHMGVTLVFGPMFAADALPLIPGKEGRPFPAFETRRPLSLVGTTCFEDVSCRGLNLWGTLTRPSVWWFPSAEATVPPQALT